MEDTDKFSDQEILARTLFGEARGEPAEGRQGVASVVMNRVAKPCWWGKNVRDVCLARKQFSCWNENDPNRAVIMEVTADDPIYANCLDISEQAINGNLIDNTGGADSYCVVGTVTEWNKGLTPTTIIGHHTFYRTVLK
jgi:N-acetylmuramoyl-L-alanine amidase